MSRAAYARIYPTAAFFFPLPDANMGLILILRVLKSGISLGYPADGGEEEEQDEEEGARLRDKKSESRKQGCYRGVGRRVPLGLVGKRFHPCGWLQRRKCSLSLSSHCAALPRFGGKPGENQSPKLEYKPISGGVGDVRSSRKEEKDERGRDKRDREIEREREKVRYGREGGIKPRQQTDFEGSRAFDETLIYIHSIR